MEVDIVDEKENIFRLDYENQNIDDNIHVLQWKQLMLKKYEGNKNLKLFKCQEDNILFYDNFFDNNYLGFCPICNKYICYYCLYPNQAKESYVFCCLKRLIYTCVFINGPKYTKMNNLCTAISICLLIPGVNFFMTGIFLGVFMEETVANQKLKKNKILKIIALERNIYLKTLTSLILMIPYLIMNAYFILGLILISIPFKLIHLKYYFGIFDTKEELL